MMWPHWFLFLHPLTMVSRDGGQTYKAGSSYAACRTELEARDKLRRCQQIGGPNVVAVFALPVPAQRRAERSVGLLRPLRVLTCADLRSDLELLALTYRKA
jgi:hypothetical protein